MGLGLYKLTNGQGAISFDGTYSNPVLWEASPNGGVLEKKYYLRMESPGEFLTAGTIYAQDAAGEDESDWFSFAGDESGGPGEYGAIYEFEIPLGSEIPVWIRVELPDGLEQEPKDDIKITASYILHIED